MGVLQLASLFNFAGVASVMLICLIVVRADPTPFFRTWLGSYACCLFIAASELAASWHQRPSWLLFLEAAAAALAAWLQIQAGSLVQERRLPVFSLVLLLVVLVTLVAIFDLLQLPYTTAAAPAVILMAVSFVYLGWVVVSRMPRMASRWAAWLGLPLILNGLWMLGYPLLASTRYFWLGYYVSGFLNLLLGVGMMALMLLGAVERLHVQHGFLAEAEEGLREARDQLLASNRDLTNEKALLERIVNHVPAGIRSESALGQP